MVAEKTRKQLIEENEENKRLKKQFIEESKRLKKELEELRKLVGIDFLTQVFNRYQIEKEVARAKRDNTPVGLLMIDVNSLKEINDHFGHQAGDKVLVALAEILRKSVREMDSVIRYGGDEFLVILPEIRESLGKIIKRILYQLQERETKNPIVSKKFPVTIAIGGAIWYPSGKKIWEEALDEADGAMYHHKERME